MITKRLCVAVLAAAVVLAPGMLMAQMDQPGMPGQSVGPTPYPQSPQGLNQPTNQPGSTPATGSQMPTTSSMPDSLGAPGQTGQQMMDKQFMRNAAEGGLADVKLGTLAVEKGSPAVKTLAQEMIDDHTAMNKDMAGVADALGVMLPKKINKESQAEYEKLNGLSGKDFDTEYVSYMAKMHYQDLHAFHMEASVAADPDLATEVVKALGMMHQHLGLIAKLAKDQDITLPPRPARPTATNASK
jgi:putative membrane protein